MTSAGRERIEINIVTATRARPPARNIRLSVTHGGGANSPSILVTHGGGGGGDKSDQEKAGGEPKM